MQLNVKCYHLIFALFTQGDVVRETCKKLGQNLKGNCSVTVEIQGNKLIATVTINGEGNVTVSKHIRASSGEITEFRACHFMISYL